MSPRALAFAGIALAFTAVLVFAVFAFADKTQGKQQELLAVQNRQEALRRAAEVKAKDAKGRAEAIVKAAQMAREAEARKLREYVKDGKLCIPRFERPPKIGDIGYLPNGTSAFPMSRNEAVVFVPYRMPQQVLQIPTTTSHRSLHSHIQQQLYAAEETVMTAVYIRGPDFSQVVDGEHMSFDTPFEVAGTTTYEDVDGATHKVHLLKPVKVDTKQFGDPLPAP